MAQGLLPLLVEPSELEKNLGQDTLRVVDLCRPEIYAQHHVPGAAHLDYAQLIAAHPPAMGLLPDAGRLGEALSRIGLTPDSHVVAYDDEGGGRAARLLWTLDVVGHSRYSLLNGGLHAWLNEGHRVHRESVAATRTNPSVKIDASVMADKTYILEHLHDPHIAIVDTRSPAEYRGEKRRADRAGHIPGAVNYDWMNAIDQARSARLKPAEEIREALTRLGVTPDKEVITYCQTHHRSAHTYIVLKILGYPRVRGYPGSWSEWGNSPDAPVE